MEPLLFTLGGNDSLATEVSTILGVPLSADKITHFADGESFAKPKVDVEDRDCYIIHSLSKPVNDRVMDLLIFIDGLKNGGANRVTVIMPYFGYARQDRIIERGDPVSGLLIHKLLQTVEVDEIICIDFHSKRLFSRYQLQKANLSAVKTLAEAVKAKLSLRGIEKGICAISPDNGGIDRATAFSQFFEDATVAHATKVRPEPNKACIQELYGDVKDKICVIIDDIIDTGGTLAEIIKEVVKEGAKEVYVAATHGILSGPAIDRLNASEAKEFFISNSIEADRSALRDLTTVSVASVICNFIGPRFKKAKED